MTVADAVIPPEMEVVLADDDNCDEGVSCEVVLPCIEVAIKVKVYSKTFDIVFNFEAGVL